MRPRPVRWGWVAGLCVTVLFRAAGADGLVAPHLRSLLKQARLVVVGEVGGVQSYAAGRLAVADFAVRSVFKGSFPGESKRLSIVESRELPTPPVFVAGAHGLAFLKPARRTTFLLETLPQGSYFELAERHAFLVAGSEDELRELADVTRRLAAQSREPEKDSVKRGESERRLAFDLVAARHPDLVADGAASLASIDDLAASLSESERAQLATALRRTDLPLRIRLALIEAVADAGLRQLVPVLQELESPTEVLAASWRALDRLGAPTAIRTLEERLAAADASVRAAAVRELLRREGADAVSRAAPIALQDPDESVRLAAVEALGGTEKPEAIPPLERVFEQDTGEVQRAAARAIHRIGGRPAAEAFARLAFEAPPESQRYAVVLLLTMTDKEDPLVRRIVETHPDPSVRRLIEHGFDVHGH